MLSAWHAIAGFVDSPRIGWVGLAVIPYAVFTLVRPLTRKCPTDSSTTHEGDR